MEYTKKLAGFCSNVSFDNLPADVVDKAKLCILDYFANVYGSLQLDAVAKIVDYVKTLGGHPEASAFGCDFKTSIHNAAFVNGATGEALEAQDGLRFGGNHPGVAVIPAALAIAEKSRLSGKKIIEAVVCGYEVADRIASAMHPHHTMSGFLPTGTCGAFGAAAAASKLMGHDAETLLNSISVAGFLLPISMAEHLMGGYTSKIVQGGQAASAGLTAAGLAGAGIDGPAYPLEGSALKGGFTQITCRSAPVFDRITDGLGERYTISDIYFKPYTSCRHTHGAAQAALALVAEEQFNSADIESVIVSTYAIAAFAVGKPFPKGASFVSAQFSLQYVVAACLLDGQMGPEQLKNERISDPAILQLLEKVKVVSDNELNKMYPDKTPSRIEIKLKGGRTLSRQVDIPHGDPRAPMSAADISAKLKRFAGKDFHDKTDRIISGVLNLETIGNAAGLLETI